MNQIIRECDDCPVKRNISSRLRVSNGKQNEWWKWWKWWNRLCWCANDIVYSTKVAWKNKLELGLGAFSNMDNGSIGDCSFYSKFSNNSLETLDGE